MKLATKIILVVLCAALVIGASVMGTMAYLQSQTETGNSILSIGNVSITLTGAEASAPYKLTPGTTIDLAPKITVAPNSQDCWLFVKIEEAGAAKDGDETYSFDDFLSYAIADGWTEMAINGEIVYYRQVSALAAGQATEGTEATGQVFDILGKDTVDPAKWGNNQLYVKETVTEKMLEALGVPGAVMPELHFAAYAIQSSGFTTADAAWNAIVEQMTPAASVTESSGADPAEGNAP